MTQQGPNPQTNMIFSIVAPVVALIGFAIIYFTKPVPVAPTPPVAVNITPAPLPANSVVMANALPNAGTASGGASGGGPAAAGGQRGGPGSGGPVAAGTAGPGGGGKKGGASQ